MINGYMQEIPHIDNYLVNGKYLKTVSVIKDEIVITEIDIIKFMKRKGYKLPDGM